jgi:hypothetical protein
MDYRVLWFLFSVFAVVSIAVLRRGIGAWRRNDAALTALGGGTPELRRRHQLDRLRLLALGGSLLAMTALVFAVLAGAPALLVLFLQATAVFGVAVGIIASVWR